MRICRLAREAVPEGVYFLGGHPMAGNERNGIENADAELFVGAKYAVVKNAHHGDTGSTEKATDRGAAEDEFVGWIKRLGAEPVEMDAETHDWAAALVSHLPQLVSTALASTVWDETEEDGLPVSLASSGFRDMVRLAESPYEIWRDICLTNSENLGRALDRLEQTLERLRRNLRSKELAEEFAQAQRTCAMLRKTRGRESDG